MNGQNSKSKFNSETWFGFQAWLGANTKLNEGSLEIIKQFDHGDWLWKNNWSLC